MSQSPRLHLLASKGAIFQLASHGEYLALNTPSGQSIFGVTWAHLLVLSSFTEPTPSRDVCNALAEQLPDDDVQTLIDELLGWSLLVVHESARGESGGFGHIESHLPMLADEARVQAYAEAIRAHAPGQRVAELGCGTGILSLLAAKAGARTVWTVEESDAAEVAQAMFRANHVEAQIALVRANSFDAEPPAPVDLVIHELFGIDPFEENVIASITDARRRWLKPGGRLLPMGFSLHACAVGGPRWALGADRLQAIRALGATLAIDFEPILQDSDAMPIRRLEPTRPQPTDDEVRTAAVELIHIDLTSDAPLEPQSTHQLPITQTGPVSAVIVWFNIQLDEERTLSTSPFAASTHWSWQVWDLPQVLELTDRQQLELQVEIAVVEGCPQLDVIRVTAADRAHHAWGTAHRQP